MKLPLYVHYDYFGKTLVCDADHHVVCRFENQQRCARFARAFVKKFNRDWRFRLFGLQPYVYTREDWLWERSSNGKA